jgi:hypothetical protein
MTEDFNKWWDSDGLVEGNPYGRNTPAFWAWEGWQAGAAAERERILEMCKEGLWDGAGIRFHLEKRAEALTKLNKAAEDNGEPL